MTATVVRRTTLRRRRSSATRRPEKTTPDETEAIKEATRLALELEWDTWKLSAKSNTWKREPGPLHYVLFALPPVTSRRMPGVISFTPRAREPVER